MREPPADKRTSTMRRLGLVAAAFFVVLGDVPARGQSAPAYRPLVYHNEMWCGSTFWAGPDWTRVGRNWHHPGQETPSVRRFSAPRDGKVRITGRAFKLDTNGGGGDGVRLLVRHGDRLVWEAQIEGKDVQGVEPNLELEVRKGDAIRFIVHKRGAYEYDSTGWDPTVAYANGETHRASEAFTPGQDGAGGWFFEMEVPAGWRPDAAASRMPPPSRQPFQPVRGDLAAMVEHEWRWEDRIDGSPAAYAAATAVHLARARRLLDDLRAACGDALLADKAARLNELAVAQAAGADPERLYLDARRLKRQIALANPLRDFGPLLFCKRVPGRYSHLVMQYYGFFARPGGGLFVLERPGQSLEARDILGGRFADGSVLEPRLSYDGRKAVFSFVRCTGKLHDINQLDNRTDEDFYHIWEVNVDGTGLRQLTSGPYDDLMPTYLPDGGIAFCSTRRRGHARCFHRACGTRWQVYTLHRMDADGADLRILSVHDTNEWFPAVSNSGHLLYARWDYIDRDAVTHQNLWSTRPDGTNPLAVWGNATSSPHCTFQAQPIPGTDRIVFTASAHHSRTGGSLAILDGGISNNGPAAITRITPDVPFPEAEGTGIPEYYGSPWPLSEKYFLAAYSPMPLVFEPGVNPPNALGLYLLDAFGNRELIYRDPEIGCETPIPLAARPVPPVVASACATDAGATGQMLLLDVYQGLGDLPRGSIRQLRIVQIFPKTTPYQNEPAIGMAVEENARAVLGTVPVEPDGSAYFELPAGKPVLFQALDADGLAYQTMRSVTYVQRGELLSCVGCHEGRLTAPPSRLIMASRRPPSRIDPGAYGGRPFSFLEVVQPVLDKHCVRCHGGEKTEKDLDLRALPQQGNANGPYVFSKSYVSLCGDAMAFWGAGTNAKTAAQALVPRFGGRNNVDVTPPSGLYGALGSRLMKILRAGHEKVRLTDDEIRRLAVWIDLNAVFYGAYSAEDQARQLRRERLPMPDVQ